MCNKSKMHTGYQVYISESLMPIRLIIACIVFLSATFVTAGEITVNNVPGGFPKSIVFTDDSGKIIKTLSSNVTVPDTQLTPSTGGKLNRTVRLIGNSNFAIMAENTWESGGYESAVDVTGVVHLYDRNGNEIFTLNTLNTLPKALSETGVFVLFQRPHEYSSFGGSDVLTVYDISRKILIEHKEIPHTIYDVIKISPNAKWLVFTVRNKSSPRIVDLVRININTGRIYRESFSRSNPIFTFHAILDDSSLTKTTDKGGSRLPDGTVKRVKKTIILNIGVQK